LAIVPRPRGGDWLDDEASEWQCSAFDLIVSLLTAEEVAEFNLEREGEACEAKGIEFIRFEIPDRRVPASKSAAIELIENLRQSVADGKTVALHCRQSVGRSAMLAAALLVSTGEKACVAFDRIASARGVGVPDTKEQELWVEGIYDERARAEKLF
jgi:protein-tyrosine phosphatase